VLTPRHLIASRSSHFLGHRSHRRNSGIALVTVLAVTVLVLGLLTLITGLTTRSARITRTDAATTALAQLADGYSDVARVVLTENLRLSKLPASAWLDLLASNRKGNGTPSINPTDPKVFSMAGNHRLEMDGATLGWEIKAVSPSSERTQWVRVAATAQDASGRSQTVLRRVQFDANGIFDLAMLTEDVNCMFCHLTVNGDVGSIHAFRPGWGTESNGGSCNIPGSTCGIGSGKGSRIAGDVFVRSSFSQDIDKDVTEPQVNGTKVSGKKNENYNGDRLPRDENGQTAFPGLDRAAARASAKGSLSGGESIRGVASGGTLSGASALTKVSGNYDGNLILIGTEQNPIKLSGDVYASGDVVIKGVVEGQGAIYAGRNVYIAGNLLNKNRADQPGTGVCKDTSSPDECARKNIAADKDELRISAGNNIIMGDFTETDSSNKPLNRRDRQAADYFREQFGLAYANDVFPTQDRYVRKGSSEELRLVKVAGKPDKYIDQLGNPVPSAEVQTFSGNDVYRNLIAPGQTDKDGNFKPWMSDDEYQKLLGKEKINYGIWRTRFRFDKFDQNGKLIEGGVTPERYKNTGNVAQKIADLKKELEAAGFPTNITEELAGVIITTPGNLPKNPWMKKLSGETVGKQPVSGTLSFDGSYLRVAMIEAYDYSTEVTQLDAFLYANNRIAGKLAARGGFVNGGLIARELGVLAPGRNGYNAAWLTKLSEADQKAFNFCDRTARPLDSVDDADNGTPGKCNYAVNYDHRLRNGGYGFNLYQGTTGITADWSFDLNGSQRVDLTP
jgi:hypothetical protein